MIFSLFSSSEDSSVLSHHPLWQFVTTAIEITLGAVSPVHMYFIVVDYIEYTFTINIAKKDINY